MRFILVIILVIISIPLLAQRQCYASVPVHEHSSGQTATSITKSYSESILGTETSERFSDISPILTQVIRIPVVVHILYNSPSQNISDAQVKSQIDALNRDFRKRNGDTVNIPERFKRFAADMEIEFVLAVVSPSGTVTNGIVRKQTSVKEWGADDKIKFSNQGGDDAWDSKSYLNIWVGNIKKTLGYSSAINGPAEKDGIVISHTVFGTIGKSGAFNLGRTLVHEAGHWLGLKHIWGDAACGDDEVEDTPQQAGFTSGCPSEFRATCGNSGIGDMYMNYMDFTDDACMNMFTYGQKIRMRASFKENGFRYSLLASKGLDSSAIKESPIGQIPISEDITNGTEKNNNSAQVLLYPNPADKQIILNLDAKELVGKEIYIYNINGVRLQKIRITSQTQVIPITSLKQGLYFMVIESGIEKLILKFIKSGNGRQL